SSEKEERKDPAFVRLMVSRRRSAYSGMPGDRTWVLSIHHSADPHSSWEAPIFDKKIRRDHKRASLGDLAFCERPYPSSDDAFQRRDEFSTVPPRYRYRLCRPRLPLCVPRWRERRGSFRPSKSVLQPCPAQAQQRL